MYIIHYSRAAVASPRNSFKHTFLLTGVHDTESPDVGVDQGKVERSEIEISIGDSHKHGTIDSWVSNVDLVRGLVAPSGVGASKLERGISEVQLSDPSNELRRLGRGGGDIAVVGADTHAGLLPLKEDLAAGESEGLGPVAGDSRGAVVADSGVADAGLSLGEVGDAGISDTLADELHGLGVVGGDAVGVGVVQDAESREVLPRDAGVILRAGRDVRSQKSPVPRLRNGGNEGEGHGVEAEHLAESHLLTGLNGLSLDDQGRNLARVEVAQESPSTGLTEASDLDVEVDELADGGEGVVVDALPGGGFTEHVGEESSMVSFLVCHELDEGAVLSSKACIDEILF